MSGILAVVAPGSVIPAEDFLRRVMRELDRRGREHAELRAHSRCTLGVCRFSWELNAGFSGPVLTASDGDLAVAADASLFYKSELARKLAARGVRLLSDAPTHLILAAYRAWGRECVEHLEGDFAFIVWDANAQTLFAARDFDGKRPLFHAMVGHSLVVASSIRAVLAYPGCPDDLNLVAIAEDAGSLTGSPTETCYRGVSRLPAGWKLEFHSGASGPWASRYWTPPVFADTGSRNLEEGAAELRELLSAAVSERLDAERTTAISLSGGFDSPALFALGSEMLEREPSPRSLRPVSISYPPGDPGREDEMIQEIVARWGSSTEWVDSTQVPLIANVTSEAAERDEPYEPPFCRIYGNLMGRARELGARAVIDGHGGDFLFQVSDRYYADLFRAGSWLELASDWRQNGGGTWRDFVRYAMVPLLSPRAIATLSRLRGRAIHPPGFSRKPPRWFDADFVARASILEREAAHQPSRAGMGMAAYESAWYLTARIFSRAASMLSEIGLQQGAERRSPFCDERVVRFAARRPRWERRSGGETKRLLRASVAGLLPAHLLEPRPLKTGVMTRYFNEGCHRLLDSLVPGSEAPMLAELGIVNPRMLHDACQRFQQTDSHLLAGQLYFTLSTDAWLRTHSGVPRSLDPGSGRAMAASVT
jgi:asparagine synthase (glutamine-hydrolysing)